jgi:hypothetical protein|tara:strand:- start:561 stop:665 length:105 start_codon:yes stop_codon:yes gene_type:complete
MRGIPNDGKIDCGGLLSIIFLRENISITIPFPDV